MCPWTTIHWASVALPIRIFVTFDDGNVEESCEIVRPQSLSLMLLNSWDDRLIPRCRRHHHLPYRIAAVATIAIPIPIGARSNNR